MFNVITWNTPYSDVKKVNASCIILHLFVIIFSIIVDFEFLYSNYTPFFKVVNDTPFFQIFIDEILCYVVFFIGNFVLLRNKMIQLFTNYEYNRDDHFSKT